MQPEAKPLTPDRQELVNSILSNLPSDSSIIVELPSECKFYKLKDPSEPVVLRPLTFEDEKAVLAAGDGVDPINFILGRCAPNLVVEDLFDMDQIYLIIKLREISYGDDYGILLVCPHCKQENPLTVQLSKLNVNPIPDDFEDPRKVTLPTINKEAVIRSPRIREEGYLSSPEKASQNLWRFVEEIDGCRDRTVIAAVIAKLPSKDARVITNNLRTKFGVDTGIKLECSNQSCGKHSIHNLPLDASFFDVN